MHKVIKLLLIVLCWQLFDCSIGHATAKVLPLQNSTNAINLKSHWQVLEDKSGSLTINDILRLEQADSSKAERTPKAANGFRLLSGNLSASYTRSVFWLKLDLQRQDPATSTEWWMEVTPNMLDDVRAYHVQNQNIISTHRSGDHTRFVDGETRHRLAVYRLAIADTEKHSIYIRIQTSSALYFSAHLYTPQAFAEASNFQSSLLGVFYGIMLAMIAYNLILMFGYRDNANVFYLLLSVLTLLVGFNNNGHLALYFEPDNVWLIELIQSLAVPSLLLFYSLFINSFLQLPKIMPNIAKGFRILQIFAVLIMIAVLAGYNSYVAATAQILAFIQMIVVIPIGMLIGWRGYRPGYIVVAATTAWIAGGLLVILRNLGVIESSWLSEYGFQIGAAIEIILLALAQADRINIIKNENALAQAQLLSISQKAEQELESKIQQRTKEMAELIERLEKLDKQKNEFLGIAAHDLKNPLTGIIGLSDLMRKLEPSITPEQRYSYLERISRSGNRMMHIITNLLDVNAMESGNAKLEKNTINIVELCHQVLIQYEHNLRAKELQYQLNFSDTEYASNPPSLMVLVDQNACFQVLDNLISNAIKYSPIGKLITIQLSRHEEFAQICIQDQGQGLTAEDQQRLFERFSKLSSVPTAGEHSTGLGLSIVKKLTEAMGGTVSCESEFGNGCSFVVELPLAKQKDSKD
ncbi:sensor histidine kinase [Undibacterium macrobrachii]|uniref:histidine kinase n=1 Tax=Undibacterium macrobrachii TaxID=1119058 RepID=A0ABQ2X9M5_9BURK|nr:sensor histidine kinase [Undibacterium macrobrachii]GGX05919.1 hybrid sensor histidine kinase/response regulator [Undibacterium macrobrachii]